MKTQQLAAAVLLAGSVSANPLAGPYCYCCKALATNPSLGDKVIFPGQKKFGERMDTYYSLSAALEPWCMVMPTTPEEVSTVITTLVDNKCPFGIRGGGHGTHALSNTLEQGVTIDLGSFNQVEYDTASKVVSIGPGGYWADVYAALDPHGVTVTGGRASSVGVGGFVLGGGNSYHSASHGFAVDRVTNFEVVLADGRLVSANQSQNPDLWRALRGGSGNFGLVTRIDMRVIDYPDPANPEVYGGQIIYGYDQMHTLSDAFFNFINNVENDVYSSSIYGIGYYPALGGYYCRMIMDNVDNKPNSPSFAEYKAAGSQIANTLRSGTMSDIAGEIVGVRTYTIWLTNSYKNDKDLLRFIGDKHKELIGKLQDLLGADHNIFTEIQLQPLTKPMTSHADDSILGLREHIEVDGPGVLFLIYFGIEEAESERKAMPLVRAYYDEVDRYATDHGLNWNWSYLNYAHGSQDPIAGYGTEHVKFLRDTSRKYDPNSVFQKLRQSGFKLDQKKPGPPGPGAGPGPGPDGPGGPSGPGPLGPGRGPSRRSETATACPTS